MIYESKDFSNHQLAADPAWQPRILNIHLKINCSLSSRIETSSFCFLEGRGANHTPPELHVASECRKTSETAPITQSAIIIPNISAPQPQCSLHKSPTSPHFPTGMHSFPGQPRPWPDHFGPRLCRADCVVTTGSEKGVFAKDPPVRERCSPSLESTKG